MESGDNQGTRRSGEGSAHSRYSKCCGLCGQGSRGALGDFPRESGVGCCRNCRTEIRASARALPSTIVNGDPAKYSATASRGGARPAAAPAETDARTAKSRRFQPFTEPIEPRDSAHSGRWIAAWVNPKADLWWGSPLRDSRLLFAQERRTRRELLPQGYQVLERKLRRAAETGSPFVRVRDLFPH
jgi:hypothetical protein